jgi:hypothetical protein
MYPERIAACVAFRSIRYSSTKLSCLGVSGIFTSPVVVFGYDDENKGFHLSEVVLVIYYGTMFSKYYHI